MKIKIAINKKNIPSMFFFYNCIHLCTKKYIYINLLITTKKKMQQITRKFYNTKKIYSTNILSFYGFDYIQKNKTSQTCGEIIFCLKLLLSLLYSK